ncbi:GL24033, partial [Drosophila persimilis]
SQLEYNRITPIPAVTSNAPFEQTFRITVLLPKDQLYVVRLGARVPLRKLLELVCDNKQLDLNKYEFRSPVDASQVYSCESTIGAVGLSEIRLCHKSESYDSYNGDAIAKFQRTGTARDSLSSSSDFSSSRHSKVTAKTPSPYSSTNSLNSMDSTGMNYTRTPVFVPAPPAKVMAPPPRKKRVAPRPPSQHCIPEQSVPESEPASAPKSTAEPAYASALSSCDQHQHQNQKQTVISPVMTAASASLRNPYRPQYRYIPGPRNINFGAWSERPKSQVAIKNEGDYIFGGAGATPAPSPVKLTIEVASPILRMGIPQRKECHVPITVKPLRDVTSASQTVPATAPTPTPKPTPVPAPVAVPASASQPQAMAASADTTTSPGQVQSSTLPRPAKSHRFTLPAGGAGDAYTQATINSLPRPVSTLERSKAPVDPSPAPFGQNTLRRTGFKERMLAREQQEQEQALSARVSVNGRSSSPTTASIAAPIPASAPAPAQASASVPVPATTAVEVPAKVAVASQTVTAAPVPAPKPAPPSKSNQVTSMVELKLQKPEAQTTDSPSSMVKLRSTSGPAAATRTGDGSRHRLHRKWEVSLKP